MGLPIWRIPTEAVPAHADNKAKKEPVDSTAAARSPIRRRPDLHGRSNATRNRHAVYIPPRLERTSSLYTALRSPRDGGRRADAHESYLPPVQTLFESVRSLSNATPPPPVPDSPSAERRSAFTEHLGQQDDAVSYDWRRPTSRAAEIVLGAGGTTRRSGRYADDPSMPVASSNRAHSQHGQPASRTLPTPPRDASSSSSPQDGPGSEDELYTWLAQSAGVSDAARPAHPLRHFWRPGSPPVDGLGDRTRSPSPGTSWEQMHRTITPDETLPSAESSFASTAASRSFNTSNNSTLATDRPDTQTTASSSAYTPPHHSGEPFVFPTQIYTNPNRQAVGLTMYNHANNSREGRSFIRRARSELGGELSPTTIGIYLFEHHFHFLDDHFFEEYRDRVPARLVRVLCEAQRYYDQAYHEGAEREPYNRHDRSSRTQSYENAHPRSARNAREPEESRAGNAYPHADFEAMLDRMEHENFLERHWSRPRNSNDQDSELRGEGIEQGPGPAEHPAAGRAREAAGHASSLDPPAPPADSNITAGLNSLRAILMHRDGISDEAWMEIGMILERFSSTDGRRRVEPQTATHDVPSHSSAASRRSARHAATALAEAPAASESVQREGAEQSDRNPRPVITAGAGSEVSGPSESARP